MIVISLLFSNNMVCGFFWVFFQIPKKGFSQALLCLYALLLQLLEKEKKDLHRISELMRRTVTDSLLLKLTKKAPHFSRYVCDDYLDSLCKLISKIQSKPEF